MALLAKLERIFGDLDADADTKDAALRNLELWLTDPALTPYRPYIQHQIDAGDGEGLLDAFWRMMPFGTGGRRGPVGAGPNRINPHTIALSVQGHCEYLRSQGVGGELAVVVAYDVREFFDLRGVYPGVDGILKNVTSRGLAAVSAETYAANGVIVYMAGRPADGHRYISTPELSFLIRELGAAGGLNISASHNHPDDNGGKFYNADGGQEIPPDDEELLAFVERVTEVKRIPYDAAKGRGLIRFVPEARHAEYIAMNAQLCPTESRSATIAYTPLNGTGTTTVLEALTALGFDTHVVPEQSTPDGSFKAVRYRIGNPEVPESMDMLGRLALERGCDIGFATDPDADRLGIIVPDGTGRMVFLNGNEIGVILIETILQARRRRGALPERPFFVNTVVTSSLQRRIAARYGCQVVGDLMVGFKYMGDVLRNIERFGRFPTTGGTGGRDTIAAGIEDHIFSCEEAHGYLLTARVRDKDACGAAVHLAGVVSDLKDQGRTLLGLLDDVYRTYGYTANRLRSLVMEGISGLRLIQRIQAALRERPPEHVAGRRVTRFVDNQVVGGPLKSGTDAVSRDVLVFELENEGDAPIRLVVRPSGTEPKTKIYVEVPSPSPLSCTLDEASAEALENTSDAALSAVKQRADAIADTVAERFIHYCLGPAVLGDAFPDLPDGFLAVSDLVPVHQKVRLMAEILPGLADRLRKGADDASLQIWLAGELRPFGEDPLGLIGPAAGRWIASNVQEGEAAVAAGMKRALSL